MRKTRRMRSSREATLRKRRTKRRKLRAMRRAREATKRKRMLLMSMRMSTRLPAQRVARPHSRAGALGEALISHCLHSYPVISHIIWGFKTSMRTEWTYNKTTLSLLNLNQELNPSRTVPGNLLKKV
jgi:hypothetical protein